MSSLELVRRGVHALSEQPRAFDFLRWILEAGYRGHEEVCRREGITDAASILDLGCGTGALAGFFRPKSYVGVDINPRYISRASAKKSDYSFKVADGRSLPFPDSSFEAVLIGGVIHHLDDDSAQKVLEESRRVLVPGKGVLVMCEALPTRRRWNLVGRLVVALDEGDFISPPERYIEMVRRVFPEGDVRHYPMRSGVGEAEVIVAHRPAAS